MRKLAKIRRFLPSFDRVLRKLNLRLQVAILLTVAMLPVGIFAVAQAMTNYSETKRLLQETYSREAVQASTEEHAAILEAFGALGALDTQLELDGPEDCTDLMRAFVEREATAPSAGYVDTNGDVLCAYPIGTASNVRDTAEFERFLDAPRRTVNAYSSGPNSGEPVLVLGQPVYRDGTLRGALFMTISSRYLQWVARSKNLSPDARFGIVASSGLGILPARRDDTFDWLPTPGLLKTYLTSSEGLLELPARSGEERVYAIAPIFERDIFEVASWPRDAIPLGITWQDLLAIALPILMWALAVAVSYFAVDQLALRHILYLDRLVAAYGRSGRSLRAQRMRDAPTEIAQLGASFDEMASEIESREQALVETVSEKETLLREVYHRVKNNLQLIISLMSLQIRETDGERERLGLERLQERIQGLALVHQNIYESENMDAVRLDRLIADIASNLRQGSAPDATAIRLTLDLDRVTVPPEKAVPLVLFATEAIVNTFKHSLSHVERGNLGVTLKDEPDRLRLAVANSLKGRAVPPGIVERKGIGQQLINGFARQLRGEIRREETDEAYLIELTVPKEMPAETGG